MTALAVLTTLGSAPARAGSYGSPQYTGGQYTNTPAGASSPGATQNYGPISGGYGYEGYCQDSTGTCGGAIQTSFAYTPAPGLTATSDPPPTSVVVTETCTANVGVSGECYTVPPTVSGGCDTGIGPSQNPLSITSWGTQPYSADGSADFTYTRYEVKSGSSPFTLSCSPLSTATTTYVSGDGGGGTADLTVIYASAIGSFTIGGPPIKSVSQPLLGGTKAVSGTLEALTGQTISAYPYYSGRGTLSNFQWSTTGGNPFETWNPATVPQYVPLSSGDADATGQTFTCNDAIGGDSVMVKCTATLTLPDGTTQTVTAASPSVTFVKPTADWPITTGFVQEFQDSQVPGYNLYGLTGDPTTPYKNGEAWHQVTVSVPSPFSGGSGSFAQLVTPDRQVYVNGNYYASDPTDGEIGLDNVFGFDSWTLPNAGSGGDNPSIVLATNAQGSAGEFNSADDNFTTWLMYTPAASGSVWVPLQKYSWNWSATVSWSGSYWQITASDPDADNEPQYTASPTDTPPSWDLVHTNSNG